MAWRRTAPLTSSPVTPSFLWLAQQASASRAFPSVPLAFRLIFICSSTTGRWLIHQSSATQNKRYYRAVSQSPGGECGFGAEKEDSALLWVSPAERLLTTRAMGRPVWLKGSSIVMASRSILDQRGFPFTFVRSQPPPCKPTAPGLSGTLNC